MMYLAIYLLGFVLCTWVLTFVDARYWHGEIGWVMCTLLAVMWPIHAVVAVAIAATWLLTIAPRLLGEWLRKRADS